MAHCQGECEVPRGVRMPVQRERTDRGFRKPERTAVPRRGYLDAQDPATTAARLGLARYLDVVTVQEEWRGSGEWCPRSITGR